MLRKAMLALVVFAVVGVVAIASSSRLQWRMDALRMKLTGEFVGLEWPDLFDEVLSSITMGLPEVTEARVDAGGPCPVVWNTPLGPIHGRSTDGSLIRTLLGEQINRGEYLNGIVDVAAGDVVLDIGGHLGTFTRAALGRGAGVVVVFEPEPTNIGCLKQTFEREIADGRVILVEAAAWKSPGTLNFSAPSEINTGVGSVAESGELIVKAVTIDDTVEELELESVDFIKMDIEGGERDALAGARRTLARHSPKMSLCVYHREGDREVIPERVLSYQPEYKLVKRYHQAYFLP